jgi:sugar transferase (PEP-CTERM/EpsH1 system associated)
MARLRSLTGLLSGSPLTLPYFRNRRLADWADGLLRDREIACVFAFSSSMAQYASRPPGNHEATDTCRIVDYVDVDSDKWRQYAAAKSWPATWIYGRESRTLLEFERAVAARSDACLFVSEAEASLFRKLAPEASDKTMALNNGVDYDFFDPSIGCESPFQPDAEAVVFTGAMDYWANVDAVVWFARDIFPAIRARRPGTEFWIVGARPAQQVTNLASLDGVRVTGGVPDVRPFIRHAKAVVAPLRLARGVQNKVLEAMAMARPVVASPEALEGIRADVGGEVLSADGARDFVDRVLGLLDGSDADAIGERARKRVVEGYGWSANLAVLKTILEHSPLD